MPGRSLILTLNKSGRHAWSALFYEHGKPRRKKLGWYGYADATFPDLTVKQARQAAIDFDVQSFLAVRAAGGLTEAAQHVKTASDRILANQLQPEITNLAAARKRTREIHDAANRKLVDIRDKVDRKISELEAAVLPSKPKDAMAMIYAGEVRAAIARMKPEERIKAARNAVEQADEPFVGAIITGSPMLTGMTETELEVVKDMWRRRHHAETVERTRRLRQGLGHLDRLSNLFTRWSGSIYAERNAAVDAAERSAALAKAAMADVGSAS